MASIEKRPDGTYRARWREFPGGPQKTKHFDRKGDAERFTDALRGDLARGVYIDPQAGRIRFQDYAEQWRAGQLHRRSTAAQTETYLRLHAYPIFGHLREPRPAIVSPLLADSDGPFVDGANHCGASIGSSQCVSRSSRSGSNLLRRGIKHSPMVDGYLQCKCVQLLGLLWLLPR